MQNLQAESWLRCGIRRVLLTQTSEFVSESRFKTACSLQQFAPCVMWLDRTPWEAIMGKVALMRGRQGSALISLWRAYHLRCASFLRWRRLSFSCARVRPSIMEMTVKAVMRHQGQQCWEGKLCDLDNGKDLRSCSLSVQHL